MRVFINGFGRIGRTILRQILGSQSGIEIAGINDIVHLDQCAYLFRYDSVYGPYPAPVTALDHTLKVADRKIPFTRVADISSLDLSDVDIVLECTGNAKTRAIAERGLLAGAARVLISGPSDAADKTLVLGANEGHYDDERIISNASCTTNAIAPLLSALHQTHGVERAHISTVHCYTGSQPVVDAPGPSLERSRAAAVSMVPTSTSAADQITRILPGLSHRLSVSAIRVPCISVSAIDAVVQLQSSQPFDLEELVQRHPGIIGQSLDPCVSSDFRGRPESLILAPNETKQVGPNQLRLLGWYDNEWGFSARMIEMGRYMHLKAPHS